MDESGLLALVRAASSDSEALSRLLDTAIGRALDRSSGVRIAPVRRPFHPLPLRHLHPHVEVFVQVHGTGRMRLRDQVIPVAPGDVLVVPSGVAHEEEIDAASGFWNLVVTYHADLVFFHLAGAAPIRPGSRVVARGLQRDDRAVRLAAWIDEAVGFHRAGWSDHHPVIRGLMQAHLALLQEVLRAPKDQTTGDTLMDRAHMLIARHLGEHRLTVGWLAQALGVTPDHLARRFRTEDGRPPLRAIAEARIALARDLLRDPALDVAAVARACGFLDQGHFSRRFRSITRTSPAAWRRRSLRATEPSQHRTARIQPNANHCWVKDTDSGAGPSGLGRVFAERKGAPAKPLTRARRTSPAAR
jgi:AraC-like DNA-binding protein